MRIFLFIISAIAALFVGNPVQAAWTKLAGQTQIIHSVFYYQTSTLFDAGGDRESINTFRGVDYNPYIEYGLRDNITLGLSPRLQLFRVNSDNGGTDQEFGLSDIEVFVRYRLWQGNTNVVSVQPLIKIPGPYDENNVPSLGSGQADAELRLQWGKNFTLLNRTHYLVTELGYRWRFEDVSNEYRISNKLNLSLSDDWDVLTEFDTTISRNRTATFDVNNVLTSEGFALYRGQISVIRNIGKKHAVQLGFFRHIEGQNTGAGGGVLVAFWQRW